VTLRPPLGESSRPIMKYAGWASQLRYSKGELPKSYATFRPLSRPFALGAAPNPNELALNFGENPYKDIIIRRPLNCETEIPVGVVSKNYKLVQHRELFEAAIAAFRRHKDIKLEEVHTILRLTRFGSRMALEFRLPEEFDFDPGDGNGLKLSFHCFNSVDGSTKLFIAFGWFRFVCENGMLVGTTRMRRKMVHNEYLELPDLAILLAQGLADAENEKSHYSKWLKTPVETEQLAAWVDGPLKKKWQPLAAARVFSICITGYDGEFVDAFQEASPSQKRITRTHRVPGAIVPANNAYAVCQALAWVSTIRTILANSSTSHGKSPT
jgi:hypothetical protein